MKKQAVMQTELDLLELLKSVLDPEIEINIVDLGLIYELNYDGDKKVNIVMTFSTPSCPLGESIIANIKGTINQQYANFKVNIDVVFKPLWTPEMVSEEGKRLLGL